MKTHLLALSLLASACSHQPPTAMDGPDAGAQPGDPDAGGEMGDPDGGPTDPGDVPLIHFEKGDRVAYVGDVFSNPVVVDQDGGGNVALTYHSSNEDVATVDAQGNVTAKGPGLVTITATATSSANGETRAAGTASLATGAVAQYQALLSFEVSAWVGDNDTELTFTEGADGVTLYRSTDPACDVGAINSCADGQSDVLAAGQTLVDTALTTTRAAYYTYEHDGQSYYRPMSTTAPRVQDPHVVVFNDRLWSIGGRSYSGGPSSTVWSSYDGMNWTVATDSPGFAGRWQHTVTVFDGKIWVIGGDTGSIGNADVQNDVWMSEDGVNWTEVAVATPFPARKDHSAFVFNDRLWIASGTDGTGVVAGSGSLADVWSTADGITWNEETGDAGFPAQRGRKIVVFGDHLIAIGNPIPPADNDIWTSADGKSWTEITDMAPFPARRNFSVLVDGDKLWMLGGLDASDYRNDLWYSTDAETWTQVEDHPITKRGEAAMTRFGNRLLVIGGRSFTHMYDDAWMSLDGSSWLALSTSAGFDPGSNQSIFGFAGKLWVHAGYQGEALENTIYSSHDGLTWTLETTDAQFGARTSYGIAELGGAMYIVGGFVGETIYDMGSDVWKSTDGVNWVQLTDDAGFPPRAAAAVTSYDGKLWVVGGLQPSGGSIPTFGTDVWWSDDGISWTEATGDAGFGGRIGSNLVAYNDEMFLIAGEGADDVWKTTNGSDWTQVEVGAPFGVRSGQSVLVFDDRMWLMGGSNTSDVYSSTDGATWTQETPNAAFSARYSAGTTVYDDKMWIIGGQQAAADHGGVWASSDGTTWRRAHRTVITF